MSDSFDGIVYRIETPDGTLFVTIASEGGKAQPSYIEMSIGKNGSAVRAWALATARLATKLLPHTDISDVAEAVTGILTDKIRSTMDGPSVRSGPEGLAIALLKYRAQWYETNKPENIEDDDDDQ